MNIILKQIICSITALSCLLVVSNATWASDNEDGVLRYRIPAINGAERFIEVLEYPTYLALALQNKGVRIAGNYEIEIKDQQTFDIKGIEVKFVKRDGSLFFYQVKLDLSILAGKAPPSLTMEVDISELRNKVLAISVSSSFIKYLPENVREIIKAKIQKIASEHNQKKVLEYLNKLSSASRQNNGIQNVFGGIVIDAYNMHINDNGLTYKTDIKLSQQIYIYIAIAFFIIMLMYIFKKFKSGARRKL